MAKKSNRPSVLTYPRRGGKAPVASTEPATPPVPTPAPTPGPTAQGGATPAFTTPTPATPVPAPQGGKGKGRVIKIQWTGGVFMVVTVKEELISSDYLMQRLSAFTHLVTKLEARRVTTYTVTGGKTPACGCDGWMRRGKCRHVELLTALAERGVV